MASKQSNPANDFFQIFINSVLKTLSQNLDKDVYKSPEFFLSSLSPIKDAESLKENNIIYKIDYVAGNHQSTLAILIPEELIAIIADILTGGSGDKPFKGTLSELEINSISKLLKTVFEDVEESFKRYYDQPIAFSNTPLFLTKDMPDFVMDSDSLSFDFAINTTLKLIEEKEFDIDIVVVENVMEALMDDLGVSKNLPNRKSGTMTLDIENIADIKINITAELGRTRVPIKYALELVKGSVVQLDTLNNSDIKVFANDVEFARAQVVAIEDNFGLRITKIISPEERLGNI